MSEMEGPILFSTEMVRAILEGRKWVTRRVVNPQPPEGMARHCWYAAPVYGWTNEAEPAETWHKRRCPYGLPGGVRYVRETWAPIRMHELGQHVFGDGPIPDQTVVSYRAGRKMWSPEKGDHWGDITPPNRWRPSIHMPKWASRIRLHVSEVRVERVQDITEEQARLEGAPFEAGGNEELGVGYRIGFTRLWDQINAKRGFGWASNPWVWAVEWNRIERIDTGETIERKAAA